MAKKSDEATITLASSDPSVPRPRLSKLIVKNFRCIGQQPVEIELDDIVVLVGPNNVGKSSILRAYEVVMSHGSTEGQLELHDFPDGKVNPDTPPEIELQTIVYDSTPGKRWICEDASGEMRVKERWIWQTVGNPKRQGFDFEKGDWDDQVPWGAPNVANARRPQPHRVEAFADPIKQAAKIVELLKDILMDRIKGAKNEVSTSSESGQSDYSKLLSSIAEFQKKIVGESKTEITKIESEISNLLGEVFPGYKVVFDARPEDDLEKSLSFFKANLQLLMGPEDGYQSTIDRQGSGCRRTLLWAALRIICESKSQGKKDVAERPHVLLMDEPELCLHPNAIREACRVLYDLPKTGNWQVMVTTHSPAFIDLSRDNTTIVRVQQSGGGKIEGTTIFRPKYAQLDENDRERLKLLNMCDPYVAEFFFGGRSIVVEGDTEYTALKHVVGDNPEDFKDVHIIRARGKATIVSLVKILNHFGSSYAVLHDSDRPIIVARKTKKKMANPAWATNGSILDAVNAHPNGVKVRLLASLSNFETAFFGEEVETEKPYSALLQLRQNPNAFQNVVQLLRALIDHSAPPPKNVIEWSNVEQLRQAVEKLESVDENT